MKSIHERVRATLAKKAREEKLIDAREIARNQRAAERRDEEFERGLAAFENSTAPFPPRGSSREFVKGWEAAERYELGLEDLA